MTKFKIVKDDVSRLREFNDIISKLKTISPTNANQVFVIENNKLEIYAIGEAGSASAIQAEIKIDLTDLNIDQTVLSHFNTSLEDILRGVSILPEGDIEVSLDGSIIRLTAPGNKTKFENKLLAPKTDQEIEDFKKFIADLVASKMDPSTRINVDFSGIIKNLEDLSSLSNVYGQTNSINISEDSLKMADNLGIFNQDLTIKPVSTPVRLHRHLTGILNHCTESYTSAPDNTDNPQNIFWYFNLGKLGIQIALAQPTTHFFFPPATDLEGFLPKPDSKIKLEIKATDFFKVVKLFDGVFDSNTWGTYNQITVKIPADFSVNKELELNHNDTMREIDTVLPVNIIEQTDTTENFSFILATKQLKKIEKFFFKDENSSVYMEFSSLPCGKPHGTGIKLYNDTASFITPKLAS